MPTHDPVESGRPRDKDEAIRALDVAAEALHFNLGSIEEWAEREGVDAVRVARRGGNVVGCWAVQKMGIFFGGRSIPVGAVRCVGVAAEHRSTGVGKAMMDECVLEAARDGLPLLALYPATQVVYRKSGYEQAGAHVVYKVPLHALQPVDRSLSLRAMEEMDHAAMAALYRRHAEQHNGPLDRGEWMWRRVFDPPSWSSKRSLIVIERDGALEGYAAWSNVPGASLFDHTIEFYDWLAMTPAAVRRLFAYCVDHSSTNAFVQFRAGPVNPLLGLLREQKQQVVDRMDWMLRIVNVPAALTARGYAAGLSAELHFDVRDQFITSNSGKFVLSVSDGAGRVNSGGDGSLSIDIRGLASLYTGHYSPFELRTMGLLDGNDATLATARDVFAGTRPWMPDMF